MKEKDIIEIFERIWNVDIINKIEPTYSTAISVAEHWSPSPYEGTRAKEQLERILFKHLVKKWEQEIINHIDNYPMRGPLGQGISKLFSDLREKYRDSNVILGIINKIARNMNNDIMLDKNRDEKGAKDNLPDPSCAHAH